MADIRWFVTIVCILLILTLGQYQSEKTAKIAAKEDAIIHNLTSPKYIIKEYYSSQGGLVITYHDQYEPNKYRMLKTNLDSVEIISINVNDTPYFKYRVHETPTEHHRYKMVYVRDGFFKKPQIYTSIVLYLPEDWKIVDKSSNQNDIITTTSDRSTDDDSMYFWVSSAGNPVINGIDIAQGTMYQPVVGKINIVTGKYNYGVDI